MARRLLAARESPRWGRRCDWRQAIARSTAVFACLRQGRVLEDAPRLRVLNVRGNSSRVREASLFVPSGVQQVRLELPLAEPPQQGPIPLVAHVLDEEGHPVEDGLEVEWSASSGRFDRERTTTVLGRAFNYLSGTSGGEVSVSTVKGESRSSLTLPANRRPLLGGRLTDAAGRPVGDGRVIARGAAGIALATSDAEGYFAGSSSWRMGMRGGGGYKIIASTNLGRTAPLPREPRKRGTLTSWALGPSVVNWQQAERASCPLLDAAHGHLQPSRPAATAERAAGVPRDCSDVTTPSASLMMRSARWK